MDRSRRGRTLSRHAARVRIALALALAAGLCAGAAAQDAPPPLDAQNFTGHPAYHGWFATMSARSLDRWQVGGGLWLTYARIPLATYTAAGLNEVVVRELMTMDLDAALGFGFADLAIGVPLHLRVAGDGRDAWGGSFAGDAVGDVTLTPRFTFLDPGVRGIGVGLAAPVTLPSGDETLYVGRDGATVAPTLLITGHVGPVRLGGNVGYRVARRGEVLGDPVGDGLVVRGAVGVSPHRVIEISGEVFGGYTPGARRGALEWLAGARVTPVDGLTLSVAGGSGTGRGIGAPFWRLVFGVAVAPGKRADRDDDGVVDRVDLCPGQAEDLDGVDDADGCPEDDGRAVTGTFEPGGWIDVPHPGCHRELAPDGRIDLRLSAEVSAITVGAAGCEPLRVELPAGDAPVELPPIALVPAAESGRLSVRVAGPAPGGGVVLSGDPPLEATWRDGRAEAEVAAGPRSLTAWAPGFDEATVQVEIGPATVTYVAIELEPAALPDLAGWVLFETASSALDDEDRALLDTLAERLIAAPDAGAVAVVGMADPRGDEAANEALARARAEAVHDHLVESGVDAARLSVQTDRSEPGLDSERFAHARRVELRWIEDAPEEE